MSLALEGKTVLITGSARRIGRALAVACGQAGADVIVHHAHSPQAAAETRAELEALGRQAWVIQADLADPQQAQGLLDKAWALSPLYALVNNAAIFEPLSLSQTDLPAWQRHLAINLTAPFLLSQAFGAVARQGCIINLLDWRALRPGGDHFPYTASKAGLAGLTRSLALALAPAIRVNGLALGAVLPPSSGGQPEAAVAQVPAGRWAEMSEVTDALLFLLAGPAYITGEIIHVDGGRHLI